jgi:hypothetical protein
MAKRAPKKIRWLPDVEAHDFPAAASYLSLVYDRRKVADIIARLRKAPVVQFKAKDIFRASTLSLLGISNWHVEKDRVKIRKKLSLAPLLLVRDKRNGKVVIADGYHRLCAIYETNEDVVVSCRIV